MYKAGVLTISDTCSAGKRQDLSGKAIVKALKNGGYDAVIYEIIPDGRKIIKEKLIHYSDNLKLDLVLTTGGTGLGPRDFTPEATLSVISKKVPGIPEAMRIGCFRFSKRAMLSRGIAGLRGKTLIVNLPGSPKGVKESLGVILGELPHALDMLYGKEH